jgi:hypothetical protein
MMEHLSAHQLQKTLRANKFFEAVLLCYFVTQASLDLNILLHLPPECWDYTCTPPHQLRKLFLFPVKIQAEINGLG